MFGTSPPPCAVGAPGWQYVSRHTRDSIHKITSTVGREGSAHGKGRQLELYTPVLVLAALAALFAVGSVAMSALVGPGRYNRAKLDSYECGIEPTPQAVGGRFPVKYYITAMLFIVFDIEIIFLYPWAVYFDQMSWFGLIEMVVFIATVFVAYAYVWRRGGLDWD
jgi:NADH-quinone oxidoreductase subunit A